MAAVLAFVPAGIAITRMMSQRGQEESHPVARHGNSDTVRKQGVVNRLVSGKSPPVAQFSEKYLEKMIRTNSAFKEREADLRTARSTALGETPKLGQNVAGPAILVGA